MVHFNHNQLRRYLIAFGSFFTNITLIRTDASGVEQQRMVVPVDYGPKERWLYRLTQDPDLTEKVGITVPRMSYELTGIGFDASRKINTLNQLKFPTQEQRHLARLYAGVPYNLTLELSILTKTQADAHQIVEQIIPLFTPDLTFAINTLPELGLVETIPLTLSSIAHSDNYEGDFEHRRAIIWSLSFGMPVMFYGPKKAQGQITEVVVDVHNSPINELSDPPLVLATDNRELMESEDGSGHIMDESTANTYAGFGKVATINVKADPLDQIESDNPTVIETLTEYE